MWVMVSQDRTKSSCLKETETERLAPIKTAVGMSPAHAISGDWNGDGKPDLAVANALSGNVSILLNSGSGVFTSSTISVSATPGISAARRLGWRWKTRHRGDALHQQDHQHSAWKGDGTFKNSVTQTESPTVDSLHAPISMGMESKIWWSRRTMATGGADWGWKRWLWESGDADAGAGWLWWWCRSW